MVKNKNFITRDSLRQELQNRQLLNVCNTTLSKILKDIGFKFKKDNGRRALMERQEIASKRIKFLREYQKNATSEDSLDVVFLDETWIFQHGSNINKTWHDNNIKSVWKESSSDGKRYIIVHAGNKEGFIDGAGLIFSTKNKSADYHDTMNSELFEKWMEEELLPKLERPSLIIMDNARYHSRLLEKYPTTQSTKMEIIQWLQSKNIDVPVNAFKSELLEIVAQYRPTERRYAVDELILKMGHSVLRLPPYHCQFNAIELVWGHCKPFYDKHIGQSGYGHEAVLNTWNQALNSVTPKNWLNCITHTEKLIAEYWEREQLLDNEISPIIINLNDSSDSSEYNFSSDSDN